MVDSTQHRSISAERKTEPFDVQVSRGLIAGHKVVHKFGASESIGTSYAPFCIGNVYQMPTSATALEAVSAEADDTAAGTGAQQLSIMGLDANWAEVTQTVEMNGLTPVALTTPLLRLYRAYVSRTGTYATGAAGSHAGALTIRVAGAGATWATISATGYARGQTQIGAYTVPAGSSVHIRGGFIHIDSGKSVDVLLMQRPNADDVTTPFSGAMRVVFNWPGLKSSTNLQPFSPTNRFMEKTDILFLVQVASGTAAGSVDFEMIQIENEQ